MNGVRWRMYDGSVPVRRLLGIVMSESKLSAELQARLRWPDAKKWNVISEASWAVMSTADRGAYVGSEPKGAPPTPSQKEFRTKRCSRCGTEVRYKRLGDGKWGRPPSLCDGCRSETRRREV